MNEYIFKKWSNTDDKWHSDARHRWWKRVLGNRLKATRGVYCDKYEGRMTVTNTGRGKNKAYYIIQYYLL